MLNSVAVNTIQQRIAHLETIAEEIVPLVERYYRDDHSADGELSIKGQKWYRGSRELLAQNGISSLAEFEECYRSISNDRRDAYYNLEHVLSAKDRRQIGMTLPQFRDGFRKCRGLLSAAEDELLSRGLPPVDVTKQGVFFSGQTFDALSAASRIMATATSRLLLIDGYIGADTLNLLPTTGIALDILTKPPLAPATKTLCRAFKTQHGSLSVKTTSSFHDRFVVIDDSTVYHFGASIKDLGKKAFMFSLIEEPELLATIRAKIASEWAAATGEV